jgi:hypothetical protein
MNLIYNIHDQFWQSCWWATLLEADLTTPLESTFLTQPNSTKKVRLACSRNYLCEQSTGTCDLPVTLVGHHKDFSSLLNSMFIRCGHVLYATYTQEVFYNESIGVPWQAASGHSYFWSPLGELKYVLSYCAHSEIRRYYIRRNSHIIAAGVSAEYLKCTCVKFDKRPLTYLENWLSRLIKLSTYCHY